jgi:hypothetical protein
MARYNVGLTRYPDMFLDIEADNEEEAIEKAKLEADFSVLESEATEVVESEIPEHIKKHMEGN